MRKLAGVRFSRLLVADYAGGGKWNCVCDCGGKAVVITNNLMRGNTTSCGCALVESRIKHGMSGLPVHHAWRQMFQRCRNPKDAAYANYGGRGIDVCKEWEDFSTFIADMGMRPKGFELDRIDNDSGYRKENCRWVTSKVNTNNRRDSNKVTYQGETLTLTEWSERTGIPARTLGYRKAEGWSLERMFDPQPQYTNKKQ